MHTSDALAYDNAGLWTGQGRWGGVGVGRVSGRAKSREMNVSTPSAAELWDESNPAGYFLFISFFTNSFCRSKGGNVSERPTDG